MTVLKFRIYWEEDEDIYRDILIRMDQTFLQLHDAILEAYGFDRKHKAVFYRSNEAWQRGREIVLQKEDKLTTTNRNVQAEPLLMEKTTFKEAVRSPNQKFIYVYDFNKQWTFLVELITISEEKNTLTHYPFCVRKEGLAPSQYGNKKPVKDKMIETEEQYDLNDENNNESFGEEGERV